MNKQFEYKHGLWNHPLYRTWISMMARCYNPKAKGYDRWGGRGITVCDRWHDVRNFVADMGERPAEHTLDRINNDGDYEPGNCKWSTRLEQSHNTRNYKNNKTGVLGISYNKDPRDKLPWYRVFKQINHKRHYIGRFRTLSEAKEALDNFMQGVMT